MDKTSTKTKTLPGFIAQFKSVVIGSIDEQGLPFTSYAPFVYYQRHHYLFISDIARHAGNLRRTGKASLLFIEDESTASNLFARKRIVLQCDVTPVPRDDAIFPPVMERFKKEFDASIMEMLLTMQDFNLYRLQTIAGEATFGFGEAYTVGGEAMQELLPRRGGTGHK